MTVLSAGVLLHRTGPDGAVQVLLAHMGGPFWARKDEGAWSIPKGEHPPSEDARAAARREFAEELGSPAPEGELRDLGTVRSGSKVIAAFALAGDLDADAHRQQHLRARMAAPLGPHRRRSPKSTGPRGSTSTPPAARS